ncbi:magnesium chelatase ATPase subunit I [Halorhodospira halophila]|uniref:Mg-protoporphyrin IX chelatase n=1 Tax=Halorhodospira halophila (strain DSM 244 / SL1) TaxID=349124 RepID=A1WXH4_HALHL|nr:magnesium chelatase ATPase subunit I [Halorhodospira halophila]ABM62386.1 protoporphyrin IX magnesium-chelatase [Halorhodospira halophila SL1]MBK1729516.1 magnesium chelatase ATPase subunit I [Halorhodospira halophila]
MAPAFPFSAIAGQDEMKLAMTIAAVDGSIGGVLVFGDRGTGKSTVVRALAGLLPTIRAADCPYHCNPDKEDTLCDHCREQIQSGKALNVREMNVPVVDLPLGVTEDRVVGALDLEQALTRGEKAFEPGLLARANRGFLYIDEVNLLEDHIVDLLLDVAASGENVVEREGLSVRHPAKFVLIGSGNPEEGELRPQLLDRFGLSVEVSTPEELHTRMQVVRRRDEYESDPKAFVQKWAEQDTEVRERIEKGREKLPHVEVTDEILERTSTLCIALGTDGLRGELTLIRAARAAAALEQADQVELKHLRQVASVALRHRLRRDPLDESGSTTRVQRAVEEHLPA